jgi:chromosome segregation ATPase
MPEPKPVVEGDKDQSAAPGPLEALVERLHADLEAVRADLAEEQELRDALSREESALREGLAAARTELAVARADLGAARRELEVTRAESSGLRRELASARAERESARGELELALKELHNSREERAGLGATLAAAQAERAELAGLLASSAAEVQRFKAEEAGLLREFDQAQAAIERLTAALASCEHKLSDETAAHASTRRELARAEEARGEVAKERRRGSLVTRWKNARAASPRLALVAVQVEQRQQRLAAALRGDLDDVAPELDALFIKPAAEVQLVLGDLLAVARVAHRPVEADRRHVVLPARVRAAGDLDVGVARQLDAVRRLARVLE